MNALSTVDATLARVLEHAASLEPEDVAIDDAAGRVLSDDARAPVDLPLFPSSAMDGFAVRAADTPATLPIVARVAAGRPTTRVLEAGEAIEISTGGVVPEGADAVVPVEHTLPGETSVTVPAAVAAGANVRRRGGDVRAGETVLPRGTVLGASRLAALAAAGVATVRSPRRPRVAIVTTGTELRRPGETLRPGEIYESNGLMLATLFAAAGAEVERLDAVADDANAHREALALGLERDVVVTSGGVSVGPHDLVRGALAELGVEEILWGVAMRPGKPFAFGVRGRTLAFGLPGNPVSSLVGALLFVRPALRALLGDPSPAPAFHDGVIATDVACHAEREDFVRARLVQGADGPVLEPLSGQESHMIVAASRADAIVRIPRGTEVVTAGSAVRYLPLDR